MYSIIKSRKRSQSPNHRNSKRSQSPNRRNSKRHRSDMNIVSNDHYKSPTIVMEDFETAPERTLPIIKLSYIVNLIKILITDFSEFPTESCHALDCLVRTLYHMGLINDETRVHYTKLAKKEGLQDHHLINMVNILHPGIGDRLVNIGPYNFSEVDSLPFKRNHMYIVSFKGSKYNHYVIMGKTEEGAIFIYDTQRFLDESKYSYITNREELEGYFNLDGITDIDDLEFYILGYMKYDDV